MSDIFNKKRVVSYSHGKKRKEEYRAYSLSCSLSCEGTARQTSASWKRALTGSCINQHLDLGPPSLQNWGNINQCLLFSSAAQSHSILCDPMNRSTPGLLVHHQPPESTQTHVHCVSDAIQPSHPLSSPSPPALNLSKHQGLFQ